MMMKILSTKDNLLEGIQIVQASTSSRATLPILHNFLMEAENGKIKLVRTDLEMATTHYINADVAEPGAITVPAKDFSEILHNLPSDKDIEVRLDSSNKVHIHCGKSKFWVMGVPKEEYPVIPDIGSTDLFEAPAEVIQRMVQKTIFAASTQETRYVLNGVLWIGGKNGLEMVATDGRRLAIASNAEIKTPKDIKVIVPTKILQEFLRFLGINKPEKDEKVIIGVASNQIGFKMRTTTFISRIIEGNFPNYEQVIPSKKDVSFEADTKELLAVTKRAALCVSDRGGAVKYQLKAGSLLVSAASQKMEFEDEIPVSYKGSDFTTSFNPQYIIDVLKNIDTASASFGMTTAINPAIVEPTGQPGCKYIVMPVRA